MYVGGLDEKVSEPLLWELFLQAGPVVNTHMPKDRVTGQHQGECVAGGALMYGRDKPPFENPSSVHDCFWNKQPKRFCLFSLCPVCFWDRSQWQ